MYGVLKTREESNQHCSWEFQWGELREIVNEFGDLEKNNFSKEWSQIEVM